MISATSAGAAAIAASTGWPNPKFASSRCSFLRRISITPSAPVSAISHAAALRVTSIVSGSSPPPMSQPTSTSVERLQAQIRNPREKIGSANSR